MLGQHPHRQHRVVDDISVTHAFVELLLCWGKKRFSKRAQDRLRHDFWAKPSEARLLEIKATRGGGSVPQNYMAEVREAVAGGQLKLVCGEAEVVEKLRA